MSCKYWIFVIAIGIFCFARMNGPIMADAPLGGYLPFVGFGLTDKYEDSETGSVTFFIAQPSDYPEGTFLGGVPPHFDIGLLDTGAATHILTSEADAAFNIAGAGFSGTHTQQIGGATGLITLSINDPLSIYVAGLSNRVSAGSTLDMNTAVMRGQTSVATLSAPPPPEWELPNIVGLPLAAQHAISIRNDLPQIFELQGRTVRTPDIQLMDLGSGGAGQDLAGGDIIRRTPLRLVPGTGFIQGPLYVYDPYNILYGYPLHDNPLSPTVVENGALFVDVDIANAGRSLQDTGFLFDTGADLTVVSEQTAVRLGFDPILDTPDFLLEVEGSGGVIEGVPGFYVDELNLDTIGGSFTLTDVPVAVLDVTNPSDPGNIVPGILGTHLFVDRNIVIDANPSIGQGGVGPSLYISDPVTTSHAWATTAATGSWHTSSNWSDMGTPDALWVANVANVSGSSQQAEITDDSQVFQVNISGSNDAKMDVRVHNGATLLVFGGVTVESDGNLSIESGGKVDALFIQLNGGGTLSGDGSVFVGAGPVNGQVRNASGTVAPGDHPGNNVGTLEIEGDFSNRPDGTLAIDLGGTTAGIEFDQLLIDGTAFLGGTLEASLVDIGSGLFTPEIGDLFEILSVSEEVSGEFESLILPSTVVWDIHYATDSVTLEVLSLTDRVPGDASGDGLVDESDASILADHCGESGMEWGDGDFTGDGKVGPADAAILAANWGYGAESNAVPEPSTHVLLFLGAVGVLFRRRRHG